MGIDRVMTAASASSSLTVAVTGPTGEIGMSAVDALEADPRVKRVLGMARRPFDPAAHGWTKTEYRQGDILDRDSVNDLVKDADVVVHLAYILFGSREESRQVNLEGTRNVFEATVAASRARRLVYTSSVAAYGYHADNPVPLTEDAPTRGSEEHYYSAQKAECEELLHEVTDGTDLEVYVLRPCIVAGPRATALADSMPWRAVSDKLPQAVRSVAAAVPGLKPVLPDPGLPLQLVHHDDVAAAIAAAAVGEGKPGAYNIAADDTVSFTELAKALGAYAVPVPHAAVVAAVRAMNALPLLPAQAEWLNAVRTPMVMDIGRARDELGFAPKYSSADTLQAMAAAL
jgi:nucleoside-diphosphate-sugar epimerase